MRDRARLQFDICQQPNLQKLIAVDLTPLLLETLRSHRDALALEPEDADALLYVRTLIARQPIAE